jgi:transcriptional regulator with XRE-family HTH domain
VTKKISLNHDIRGIVGRQVRRLRKVSGLSQESLSDRCGIFRTYLSRVEGGTANPTINVLVNLATALGVNITDLFAEDHPH